MSQQLIKIGGWVTFNVEGKLLEGEVLTHCGDAKNKGRFRATIRDTEGNIHCVWLTQVGAGFAAEGWRVDLAEAEALARGHLSGKRVNAPLEDQFNILAAAVLQLRGAA